jgi:hypothetical protein
VPEQGHYRNTIMDEAHNSAYSIQSGATKMYVDLRDKLRNQVVSTLV